jgi:uroporphyrin-3 C-methyltransferase
MLAENQVKCVQAFTCEPTMSTENADPLDKIDNTTAVIAKPKKRFFSKLLLLLLLLAMAAGGAWLSYDLWLKLQQTQQTLNDQTTTLEQRIADLNTQIQPLIEKQTQPDALPQLTAQVAKIQQQQQNLNLSVQGFYQQLRQINDNQSHNINEISTLLYIANQHLLLAHDIDAALSALKAADLRLRDMQSPELLLVRQQLNQDIEKLQLIEKPDLIGMNLQLAHDATQVPHWPLLQGLQTRQGIEKTEESPAVAVDWSHTPQMIWQELRQLVVIRHNEQAERGLLSASQRALLSQTLQAKLDMARLQLQRHDQASFQQELQAITQLLRTYYDTNAAEIKTVQTRLNQWQEVVLNPVLPDISKTLAMLQQPAAVAPTNTEGAQ